MIILKEKASVPDEPFTGAAPIGAEKISLSDGRYHALWYGYRMELMDPNGYAPPKRDPRGRGHLQDSHGRQMRPMGLRQAAAHHRQGR